MVSFSRSLLARCGLFRLGGVGAETLDEFLQFIRLVGDLTVIVLLLLEGQLARLVPEIVVAHVDLDQAEVDIGDVGADLIEEVAVVGDDDHRILEAEEEILQPGDRLEVEVVGRFVQQEHVRVAEQSLGEEHAYLVAAFEFLHLFVTQLFRNAEAV